MAELKHPALDDPEVKRALAELHRQEWERFRDELLRRLRVQPKTPETCDKNNLLRPTPN